MCRHLGSVQDIIKRMTFLVFNLLLAFFSSCDLASLIDRSPETIASVQSGPAGQFAVSIEGVTSAITVGTAATFIASAGSEADSVEFTWYLNGVLKENGPVFSVGGTECPLGVGTYTISVIASTVDGSKSATASRGFSVQQVSAVTTAKSLRQYGVTWEFDREYPTGTFANGDKWVVGPVKIVRIDPPSAVVGSRTINGSMLNPEVSFFQGYDSSMFGPRESNFDPSLNAARPGGKDLAPLNPLTIATGSLVSGISIALDGNSASRVRVMAVLTVLGSTPPEGGFRPPFVGTDKSVKYRLADVRFDALPKLVPPTGTPSIEDSIARFEKPYVEHMYDWQKQLFCAPDNMPNYGQTISYYVSEAACQLVLDADPARKRLLATRLIQLGIDNYGMAITPKGRSTWSANGGHMSGRAFPILFAGFMLNDPALSALFAKTGRYACQNGYSEGNLPPDYVHFGEIDQTFYVTQRDVDRSHGVTWAPDLRAAAIPYAAKDIGKADWGMAHAASPLGDNNNIDSTYRMVNTPSWAGFVLASRILGIKEAWNHPALFDYMDSWMDDMPAQTAFLQTMWNVYRPAY
jgi:hypothetical protein